jgi:hypothetical protein
METYLQSICISLNTGNDTVSKIFNRDRAPGDDDGSDNENVRTDKTIQHGTSYMLQKDQERYIELHTLMHWNSPEIYQEITKMGCTEKNQSGFFQIFLCVRDYRSWESPDFVGFIGHRAHILHNSPRDTKCTGLFRVKKI